MKRTISLILALVLCLGLSACGSTVNASKEISPGKAEIKKCTVEISKCEKRYNNVSNGEEIAVVWVNFTNNSDTNANLIGTASIKAYQNGAEIKEPFTWYPGGMGFEHSAFDDVLPGYSVCIGFAFNIKDTTTPVLIQICEGSTVITEQTFNLS